MSSDAAQASESSPGWFTSMLMETHQDGARLAPFSSPANTHFAIMIDNDSYNLADLEYENDYLTHFIKGEY